MVWLIRSPLRVCLQFALTVFLIICIVRFPEGGAGDKEPACQCRRLRRPGFNPGLGRSPGEWNGYPLQYSCLENPMDRGDWWATVRGVIKSQTRARFGSTYTKIGTIQRSLAWPLRKDDTQIREAFHIFTIGRIKLKSRGRRLKPQTWENRKTPDYTEH